MPEAVIVAATRSPIGRAFKGSLTDLRPDDLAATIIRAALDQVPELDVNDIDDLMLGCGLPGGEQGFNMGRVVAVLLGLDQVPGTTITRYCASSLQTSRMALHAIRAGEGDVFISAGVETVSRFVKGNSRFPPGHPEPGLRRRAGQLRRRAAAGGGPVWTDPRDAGLLPDVYLAMGQTAENLARCQVSPGRDGRIRRAQPEPRREGDRDGFWAREITPVTLPDGTVVDTDDCPRPASPSRRVASSSRCSGRTAGSPPATPARSTTARPPW